MSHGLHGAEIGLHWIFEKSVVKVFFSAQKRLEGCSYLPLLTHPGHRIPIQSRSNFHAVDVSCHRDIGGRNEKCFGVSMIRDKIGGLVVGAGFVSFLPLVQSAIVSVLSIVKGQIAHTGTIVDSKFLLPIVILNIVDPSHLYWSIPFRIEYRPRHGAHRNRLRTIRLVPTHYIAAEEEQTVICILRNPSHLIVDYVLVYVRISFCQSLLREKSELVGCILKFPDYLYLCWEGEGDLVDGAIHLEFVFRVQENVGSQGGADVVVV